MLVLEQFVSKLASSAIIGKFGSEIRYKLLGVTWWY